MVATDNDDSFDYIVVGSGAGGGPLAADLARGGHRVLLLEAGGDDDSIDYLVPAFHPHATENPFMRFDYFVKHYSDPRRQRLDSKYVPEKAGVLYPRAGTLGGCTAHSAMISIVPPDADWDAIAKLTGDPTWCATGMHRYFAMIERCGYVPQPAASADLSPKSAAPPGSGSGHGFNGWLGTEIADPRLLLGDPVLLSIALATATVCFKRGLETGGEILQRLVTAARDSVSLGTAFCDGLLRHIDPNDREVGKSSPEGLMLIPFAAREGRRCGAREYIRETQRIIPDRLVVRTDCLATRVVLTRGLLATGVEYFKGERLYSADPLHLPESSKKLRRRIAKARREVILAAGAFNTPQLLMLSGIGPADDLKRVGITSKLDRIGVGRNLQDRYEVGVVSELPRELTVLRGLKLQAQKPGETPDRAFAQWQQDGTGIYGTNGVLFGVAKRSSPAIAEPDVFIFGIPGHFSGYFPGYSRTIVQKRGHFTWAVLKARTLNHAGTVSLKSDDPTDTPEINFRYFDEGSDRTGTDLDAVLDGVRFAREISELCPFTRGAEILPGPGVETDDQLRTFVQREAWGHHASSTCRMGRADDPTAVVDSAFRVIGTKNLRVVDASVFPRPPGLFPLAALYMISKKASESILAKARETPPRKTTRAPH